MKEIYSFSLSSHSCFLFLKALTRIWPVGGPKKQEVIVELSFGHTKPVPCFTIKSISQNHTNPTCFFTKKEKSCVFKSSVVCVFFSVSETVRLVNKHHSKNNISECHSSFLASIYPAKDPREGTEDPWPRWGRIPRSTTFPHVFPRFRCPIQLRKRLFSW